MFISKLLRRNGYAMNHFFKKCFAIIMLFLLVAIQADAAPEPEAVAISSSATSEHKTP